MAPAYFIYLLRNYCIVNTSLNFKNVWNAVNFKNSILLGSVVLSVFFVTYIPFYDHIGQVRNTLTAAVFFIM